MERETTENLRRHATHDLLLTFFAKQKSRKEDCRLIMYANFPISRTGRVADFHAGVWTTFAKLRSARRVKAAGRERERERSVWTCKSPNPSPSILLILLSLSLSPGRKRLWKGEKKNNLALSGRSGKESFPNNFCHCSLVRRVEKFSHPSLLHSLSLDVYGQVCVYLFWTRKTVAGFCVRPVLA